MGLLTIYWFVFYKFENIKDFAIFVSFFFAITIEIFYENLLFISFSIFSVLKMTWSIGILQILFHEKFWKDIF